MLRCSSGRMCLGAPAGMLSVDRSSQRWGPAVGLGWWLHRTLCGVGVGLPLHCCSCLSGLLGAPSVKCEEQVVDRPEIGLVPPGQAGPAPQMAMTRGQSIKQAASRRVRPVPFGQAPCFLPRCL